MDRGEGKGRGKENKDRPNYDSPDQQCYWYQYYLFGMFGIVVFVQVL